MVIESIEAAYCRHNPTWTNRCEVTDLNTGAHFEFPRCVRLKGKSTTTEHTQGTDVNCEKLSMPDEI